MFYFFTAHKAPENDALDDTGESLSNLEWPEADQECHEAVTYLVKFWPNHTFEPILKGAQAEDLHGCQTPCALLSM